MISYQQNTFQTAVNKPNEYLAYPTKPWMTQIRCWKDQTCWLLVLLLTNFRVVAVDALPEPWAWNPPSIRWQLFSVLQICNMLGMIVDHCSWKCCRGWSYVVSGAQIEDCCQRKHFHIICSWFTGSKVRCYFKSTNIWVCCLSDFLGTDFCFFVVVKLSNLGLISVKPHSRGWKI